MQRRERKHRLSRAPGRGAAGVSLIELIMVIVIVGVVGGIIAVILVYPLEGYEGQVRRAELVDAAEITLRRVARDVRRALPNSVRVRDSLGNTGSVNCTAAGVTCAIEVLNTLEGARYREGPGTNAGSGHNHAQPQYRLNTGGNDPNGFNIVGRFTTFAVPFASTTQRIAINNMGGPPADAYADANLPAGPYVMTNPNPPQNTTFTIADDPPPGPGNGDEHNIAGNFHFRLGSQNQRMFIVDTPISYVCSPGANGSFRRFWNYAINATQPTNPSAAPLSGGANALVSTGITNCRFIYQAGNAQRFGVITIDITVGDAESGERVRLLHQVHVDNVP